MKAHHLIAAFDSGMDASYDYWRAPEGVLSDHKKWLRKRRDDIWHAEKFVFESGVGDKELLDTALEMMRAGIFSLPYPTCYFEWPGADGQTAGVIVADVDVMARDGRVVTCESRTGYACAVYPFFQTPKGSWVDLGGAGFVDCSGGSPGFWSTTLMFDDDFYVDASASRTCLASVCTTVACSVVVLNARGVLLDKQEAPVRLNRARARKGKTPLFDHSIVRIGGASHAGGNIGVGKGHASPRLHWRRGHVRQLPSGGKTLVRPCLVGDPRLGVRSHDYVVAAGYGV